MFNRLILLSICLTIIALPWYVVRFKLAGVPTTLLECIALLSIGLWGLGQIVIFFNSGLLKYVQNISRTVRIHKIWVTPVFLFVISATIAVLASDNLTAALGIYKAYIIEPVVMLAVIVSSVKNRKDWWMIVFGLLLMSLQVSLLALTQQLVDWPNFAPDELMQGRTSAMFNTANAVGLLIAPIAVLAGALAIGLWQKNKRRSIVLWLVSGLNILAIILSDSAGAMVALLATCCVGIAWFLLGKRSWISASLWSKFLIVGLIAYVAGTLLFLWQFNHPPQVANPYTRPGFSTLTVRQCTWEGTTNLLKENPIFGSGLAGFSDSYLKHATCDAEPLVYPHNLVLNFWVETGLAGLVSMLWLTAVWLLYSKRILILADIARWAYLGLCLVPIYWLVHGLVDVPYFKNDLAMIWWILFGLLITTERTWKAEAQDN